MAFPDELDLTEESLRLFPELAELADRALEPGWPKRRLSAPAMFGARVVSSCPPVALVLPRVTRSESSTLVPVEPAEALVELVPNVLLTERAASQAHLDALGLLVRSAPCYRLELGRDLDELSGLLGGVAFESD